MSWRSRSRSTQPPYRTPTEEEVNAAARGQWRDVTYFKEQDMTDYAYTECLTNIDSSAVKEACYNSFDKTLVVVMRSNGNAYRYDGVPSWIWGDFKRSSSKGTTFATKIKPNYGPSKYLGTRNTLTFGEYGVTAPSMGSVTSIRGGYVPLGGRTAPTAAAGTPKALVDNSTTSTKVEALPNVKTRVRKATTSALIEGVTGKEHTVSFDDKSTVDEALAEIDRLSKVLGVDVKVKAVTVHFE